MKYQVFENDKPADNKRFSYLKGLDWNNSSFDTFEEALKYAKSWLGDFDSIPPNFAPNQKYDYSGYGDTIEICMVEG